MLKSCWCVLPLFVVLCIPSSAQTNHFSNEIEVTGTITGLPLNSDCSVEIDGEHAEMQPIRTPCFTSNSFRLSNVKSGEYKLVVHYGTNEYSEPVTLMSPHEYLEIRIPAGLTESSAAMISVSQMKIPPKAQDALQKAMKSFEHSDLNKANDYLTKALQLAPRFAEALTMQAVVQMAKQDFKSALQTVSNSAAIDPKLPMTQFVRAAALNAVGEAHQAQIAAEEGIRLSGNSWQGHYELGKSLIAQRNFKQALLEIDRAAKSVPNGFAEIFLVRASAMLGLKDFNGAQQNLNEFSKLSPGDNRSAQLEQMLKAAQRP
jgi:tetratricopeptide (TPR) repeat protein